MKLHWPAILTLSVTLVAVLPTDLLACPVCFDASDETRAAFLTTAIAMTTIPLAMVGGTLTWLRKRFREHEAELDETIEE